MFGVGASVTASILLSQGKIKAANINITQALGISTLLILVMSALCLTSLEPIGRLDVYKRQLPSNSRLGVFIAYRYYTKLLQKIKKTPAHKLITHRIRIPDVSKALLL